MPDLPTLTLSQAHFDRVVAAFPGATLAAKADAYKAWLVNRLIERVEQVESIALEHRVIDLRAQALADLHASLPEKMPEPPLHVLPEPPLPGPTP